ncbi:MAG: phospho-N-acetylmuramoyl-pentapeptide-transferase [Kiritimatiellia bacterium]
MLYHLARYLTDFWGPFRLFQSHAFLLTCGTLFAALLVLFLLPRGFDRLPHDHGKAILGKEGMVSKGKPTGGGFYVTLLALPVILLVMPLRLPDLGVIACLYLAMLFGYLDDRSDHPWGELRKGLLDVLVSVGAAVCIFWGYAEGTGDWSALQVWLPFVKGMVGVPGWLYVPAAGFMLWFIMNATNCSDGVDGLAGTLTLVTIVVLAGFLYGVIGNLPLAQYFRIFEPFVNGTEFGGTHARMAARWSVMLMTVGGSVAGYLWWNAEPSKVLMGDAGSRFLGLLVGVGVLVTGNPFLVFAMAPVVLVNGGGGLGKLVLLRLAKRLGFQIGDDSVIRRVRFPLHDHCKKNLRWSNAQVLMRFALMQSFLMPLLMVIFIKIR